MSDNFTGSHTRKSTGAHGKHDRENTKSTPRSSVHRRAAATPPSVSFLFVVNELVLDRSQGLRRDEWFNKVPPEQPSGYVDEIPSPVMRYTDGQVTLAEGYSWFRSQPHERPPWLAGSVCACNIDGDLYYDETGNPCCAPKYKEFTVFSCNPLLPIVVMDRDPTIEHGIREAPRFSPLFFFHPRDMRGVSQAATEDSNMGMNGPGLVKYVAGNNPSWIPSLVPPTYSTPEPNAPPSQGLGGELPILIGLMAFSEAGGADQISNRIEDIFLGENREGGRWRGGRWYHDAPPRGYAQSMQEDPRGFLVAVFLDPTNPEGSTKEALHDLEFSGVIVRESQGI